MSTPLTRQIEGFLRFATESIVRTVEEHVRAESDRTARKIERLERRIDDTYTIGDRLVTRSESVFAERSTALNDLQADPTTRDARAEYLRGYAQALSDVGSDIRRM